MKELFYLHIYKSPDREWILPIIAALSLPLVIAGWFLWQSSHICLLILATGLSLFAVYILMGWIDYCITRDSETNPERRCKS